MTVFWRIAAILLLTAGGWGVHALDLPITTNFRLGQGINIQPGKKDHSKNMGLAVNVDTIRTSDNHLALGGTIWNHSDRRYDAVSISFSVNSYDGIGVNRGFSRLEPEYLLPGGMGRFVIHIDHNGVRPRTASYVVSATPAACIEE